MPSEKHIINYSDDRIDNMLLGDAVLNKEELIFKNSLINNNPEFIRKLLWRYLVIPASYLANVPAIIESPYARLEPSNPNSILAS